jgi:Diacylglycerol kinase
VKKYHKGNRLLSAWGFSVAGLKAAWQDEAAFRQVIVIGIVGLIASVLLPLSAVERVIWLLPVGISWIVELLNSSIENVVDLCSPDIHPLAKKAKDMGSAAQMIASGVLLITWCSLLWEIYFR